MIRTDLIAPVAALLERQAAVYPAKIAYSDAARSITYAALDRDVANLATNLKAMGLAEKASVAIWLPNSVDWVVACFAILRAGGVVVPISYDSAEGEAAYRLEDAACAITISKTEKLPVLEDIARREGLSFRVIVTDPDGEADRLGLAALCASPAAGVDLVPDDIEGTGYIVYTSGTTGRPKGVMLTTRAMLWVNAACWSPILGIGPEDRILSPLPLFHSYALNLSVLSVLANGCSEHILERFSTEAILRLLAEGGFTVMPGVPTMFQYLLNAMESAGGKPDIGALRRCVSAGAIMPGPLNRAFEAMTGIELLDGYGITETATMVTLNWPGAHRIPGSCGLPLPGLAVRIVDPKSGKDVAFGEEGELICRGPNLMLGYHNKKDATESALRDGWYHTGDLARSDKNGFLTITGRLKEIIIRGGQNIAPAEVEEVVLEWPELLDCAVVAMSHDALGEVPVAFVVTPEGRPLDEEGLTVHCRKHLSAYKVPVRFFPIDLIPRTGSGKTLRFKLREIAEAAE